MAGVEPSKTRQVYLVLRDRILSSAISDTGDDACLVVVRIL